MDLPHKQKGIMTMPERINYDADVSNRRHLTKDQACTIAMPWINGGCPLYQFASTGIIRDSDHRDAVLIEIFQNIRWTHENRDNLTRPNHTSDIQDLADLYLYVVNAPLGEPDKRLHISQVTPKTALVLAYISLEDGTYHRNIQRAAQALHLRFPTRTIYYLTQWDGGTTLWRDENNVETFVVTEKGEIT